MSLSWTERDDPHTVGIVYVNGQKMRATFDTGSPSSFITQAAAARAGVKVTDPGVTPLGEGGGVGGSFTLWAGIFADVKIGDEEIKNTPLQIGATKARSFDIVLGADFFASHHVYVSNSQGKAYFAYEGGPVFVAKRRVPVVSRPAPVQPPPFGRPVTLPGDHVAMPTCPADATSLSCAGSPGGPATGTERPR
jgi:hypothetical protein